MVKKKSDLSRLTRQARRVREARLQETEEQREHRLAVNRQYYKAVNKRNSGLHSSEMLMELDQKLKNNIVQTTHPPKEEPANQTKNDISPSQTESLCDSKQTEKPKQGEDENKTNKVENLPKHLKMHRVCKYKTNNLKT